MPRIAGNRVKRLDILRLHPVRKHLKREVLANVGKHHVIHKADARRRPFDIEQNATARESHGLDLHHRIKSHRLHVRRPQAHRRILLVHPAFHIVGRPPALILEQPNAANCLVLAQVKPVLRPARHVDQIARLNLNGEHRTILRMNVKHAAAADREPHFVLGVRVLLAEFGEHCIEVRCRRRYVDHVRRDKPTGLLQPLDLRRISREYLLIRRLRPDPSLDIPILIPDAKRLQKLTDLPRISDFTILVLNTDADHFESPISRDETGAGVLILQYLLLTQRRYSSTPRSKPSFALRTQTKTQKSRRAAEPPPDRGPKYKGRAAESGSHVAASQPHRS